MDALLLQHLLNWLVLASIYTLIAIGFSLLFGLLDVIHFSHGDVSIIGPFIALGVMQIVFGATGSTLTLGIMLLALVLAVVMTGLVGIGIDRAVISRFRAAPAMMALVATVALGTAIREVIRGFYPQGANPKAFPALIEGSIQLGSFRLPMLSLLIITVTVLIVASMYYLIGRTPVGMRIRAVAEDAATARLMGIRPQTIFAFTFFIASATGALGALLFASYTGVLRFDFGVQLGLIGFSAAVIGGLGSMMGAILGALAIAGIETVVQVMVPGGASYRLVFVFLLVITMLSLRPSGLLGKPVLEKV
ncbi:MAG: branched-chain amino acid ABC transporter permease [Paracoccus sp. (in: a-proteobacteria)]|nr:branched-chain amino acid ABC transporter permease [Paracoccus sp. (in: a-proteobacteria)]